MVDMYTVGKVFLPLLGAVEFRGGSKRRDLGRARGDGGGRRLR